MLIVVAGQTRNVGKTGVMAGIIAATPEMRWTAVKISQHLHDQSSRLFACESEERALQLETQTFAISEDRALQLETQTFAISEDRALQLETPTFAISEERALELETPTFAISEECDPASGKDSARYLHAGAARSYWVRTERNELAKAMPRVRQLISETENAIVESNSVLAFLKPDLVLFVADPHIQDFKTSAHPYLDRVDAWVFPEDPSRAAPASNAAAPSPSPSPSQQQFIVPKPGFMSPELAAFVRACMHREA